MSMSCCQYCGLIYDQDYNVEHEDECESNIQEEILEETTTLEEKIEKFI